MFIDANDSGGLVPVDGWKDGEFKLGNMAFFVPADMAEAVSLQGGKRLAKTADGVVVDLATLEGEAVFRLDDIRVEQLGWLSAWRTVEYILVNQKEWLVAVCVG